MNAASIYSLLDILGSTPQGDREWILCNCPWAPWTHHGGKDAHPSASVMVSDTGESIIKCWTCHQHPVNMLTLVMDIRRLNKLKPQFSIDFGAAMKLIEKEGVDIPGVDDLPDFDNHKKKPTFYPFLPSWLKSFPLGHNHPYLEERGITPLCAYQLGVVFDPKRKRIGFPIYNHAGKLAGLHGRDVTNYNEQKHNMYAYQSHRNTDVWLGEQRADLQKPLVITEGTFDYAKVFMAYENVLAGLTASVSKRKLMYLQDAFHLISFYDYGVGGDKARETLQRFCMRYDIGLDHIIPSEEQGDAGNMDITTIILLLKAVL